MRIIRFAIVLFLLAFVAGDAARPTLGQQAQPKIDASIVNYNQLCDLVQAQKGKVVLLDFWATTCIPCKQSFHHTVEMHNAFRDKGLVVISVATNPVEKGEETAVRTKVLDFLKSKNATFTNVILDESGELMKDKLRLESIPCLYVFNREGKWTQFIGNDLKPDDQHRHVDVQRYIEYALAQPGKN